MENFYSYTIENYALSGEAKRILDSVVKWASDTYEYNGQLNAVGRLFIKNIIADNIGMDEQEIIDNWIDFEEVPDDLCKEF